MRFVIFIFCATVLFGCESDWLDYSPADMYSANIEFDDSDAPMRLNVAAVTISSDQYDKAKTLASMEEMIDSITAVHPDVQVIEFGELILGWYYDASGEDYQRSIAETVPGPSTDFLLNLAVEKQVNIVFGMPELDSVTNAIYNAQVLIRNTGEILVYRKRNLNDLDITNGFSAGNEFVSTNIDGVEVAMFICSDMQSSIITEEMAESNADVILQSVTSTTDLNASISYVGLQMNKWIVFANRSGVEDDYLYTGFSHIINPAGTITDRVLGDHTYVYRSLGIY